MKEIPLTQGKGALIDDEDYECVSQFKWYAAKQDSRIFYAVRKSEGGRKNRRMVFLHRFLLGAVAGQKVDHKDGDGLNCQRYNIRFATSVFSARNRREYKTANGFKGVFRSGKGSYAFDTP